MKEKKKTEREKHRPTGKLGSSRGGGGEGLGDVVHGDDKGMGWSEECKWMEGCKVNVMLEVIVAPVPGKPETEARWLKTGSREDVLVMSPIIIRSCFLHDPIISFVEWRGTKIYCSGHGL